MIQRMLAGGLIAGFAAGLLAALLHFALIQEYILLGEQYETGALVHFAGAGGVADGAGGHEHAAGEAAHDHGGDGGTGGSFARNALTVLFTGLIYAGYGLVLVAGFALAEQFGRSIDARQGALWGIAAFAAVQLAPAMGLAPELPGSVAADLGARQAWWLGTVVATAAGLGFLAWGRGLAGGLIGGALLAAPHVIGAPHVEGFFGVAPPEVAAAFTARVLGVGLVAWVTLGWLAARLWARPQP
ncbi:MAG: cobalt transporter [Alphaproteobacteria bacterium HGW-Alphaproteobacteria-6]|nr:MAG: cobalt transporter [Alphaproteobacteria bacterium HGW-Alphaproteobacteria-6]